MDPIKAAQYSLALINPELLTLGEQHSDGDGSKHMVFMLQEICKGEMSIGKANRWLGWAQCLMMIYNHASLAELKDVNRRASDGS